MAPAARLLARLPPLGPAGRAALLVLAVAAALAVRLATWPWVLGGEEVRIVGDGDVLYHLRQAGRLVAGGLGAVWVDPWLDYPVGATVHWPPLFDALLAGAGWLAAGGAAPDAAALLRGGVWVPPVLGVVAVLLVARLGAALLGGRPWLDAALVLALLPGHAGLTALGRPDHHALEPVLLAVVLLAVARVARGGGRGAAAALALGTALAFWNWNGSALYLALVAAFAAAWHAAAAAGDGAPGRAAALLAVGLLGGAALLAASAALLGAPGALGRASLSGLTGLQAALAAGAALACAALAAARRLAPGAGVGGRLLAAAGALLLPPALLLLVPWSRQAFLGGLDLLGARGWYRSIQEFQPLLPSGTADLATDLERLLLGHGLTPLAVAAAVALAARRWRAGPRAGADAGAAVLLGVTAAGALALGWARNRFSIYLALAEALATALVARELAAAVAARWPARRLAGPAAGLALGALLVAPALPALPGAGWAVLAPERYADLAPLGRLAAATPAPPGREAVQAPWNLGHDLLWFAGRPVISSPFGVDGGPGALEADAAFHRAVEQADAEALLAARRAGLVVVAQPLAVVVSLAPFAPAGAPPVFAAAPGAAWRDGVEDLPAFRMLVATRLWLWDGGWGGADGRPVPGALPALDAFRLLGEGQALFRWRAVTVPATKLFQWVPGARVTVRARPGARVEARVQLVTDRGRLVTWATEAVADAGGRAALRLPYATGRNGAVLATPWRLGDGREDVELQVPEAAVLRGEPLEVALGR